MEKKYYFKLNLKTEGKTQILNIKPVPYCKKGIPYPISFSELNVPIIINNNNYVQDSFDLKYFLDFESGFDEKGEKRDAFNRKNLMHVLSDLNKTIDENLRKALCGESKLKGKYTVVSDNGLGEYSNLRLGEPRTSKSGDGSSIRKKLSS